MKLSSGKLEFTTKSSDKFSLPLQSQITGKIGKENHTIWTKRSGNNPHTSLEAYLQREMTAKKKSVQLYKFNKYNFPPSSMLGQSVDVTKKLIVLVEYKFE